MKKIMTSLMAFFLTFSWAIPVLADDGEGGESFPVFLYLVIALAIGFVISLIINLILRGQLKSVRANNAAEDYVVDGSLNVTDSCDLYLYTRTRKTRKQKNDNK